MKPITQEEPAGCGIACVAFLIKKRYKETKKHFVNKDFSSFRGYYCGELVNELKKQGLDYKHCKVTEKNKKSLKENSIVFIERCKKYPIGHYLVKTKKGWMNPWINYPNIKSAKSGFQKNLPLNPAWIIYIED